MKILFINAINESRKSFTEFGTPALGILYLASYLSKYGSFNDIRILECGHIDEQALRPIKPDIVGVSSVTQNFMIAKNICAEVKRTMDVPVIMGGVHISTLPQSMTADMDVGVVGEGEETILELANAYESNGLDKRKLWKIGGIAYRDGGHLITTPHRDLIVPLDRIPFPARHLIRLEPIQRHALLTARGCPYRCVFCSPYAMWHTIRYHSPEYVVSEMRQIYTDYHSKSLSINDDLFTVNKSRLKQIVALIKKEEFYGDILFTCQGRANLMDGETARLLKEMGIASVCMGLESGSQRMLSYLKCGSVTVEDNERAIDALADAGIEPVGGFIFGSPTETKEEMLQTLNFIKNSRLSHFQIAQLLPYPGTKVWEEAKAMGIVSDDMNWNLLAYILEGVSDPRVNMSMLPTDELATILSLFLKQRAGMLRRKIIIAGLKHPDWLLGFTKRKYEFWKYDLWKKLRRLGQGGIKP
jgi:radical SAM superfamily enzyme YgiQ (UPF0313 family)